jgi:hypothetical protein
LEKRRLDYWRPTVSSSRSSLVEKTVSNGLPMRSFGIRLSLVIPGFVDAAVFDNARQGSEHLRNDESNPYRQMMFDLDDLATKNLKNPLSPKDVAQVILRAATETRP